MYRVTPFIRSARKRQTMGAGRGLVAAWAGEVEGMRGDCQQL